MPMLMIHFTDISIDVFMDDVTSSTYGFDSLASPWRYVDNTQKMERVEIAGFGVVSTHEDLLECLITSKRKSKTRIVASNACQKLCKSPTTTALHSSHFQRVPASGVISE